MTIEELKKTKIIAMKNKQKDEVTALNVLISKLMALTIEKRSVGAELTEADFTSVVTKVANELKEERTAFFNAGRTSNVESLDLQIACISKYLPSLMTKAEILAEITKLEDKSMPVVMRHFKSNFAGKVDMREVQEVLKSIN